MKIGDRYAHLMANASRNISRQRRDELLEEFAEWAMSEACSAKGAEELFWLAGAEAGMFMGAYCEELQVKIGGQIIEQNLAEK